MAMPTLPNGATPTLKNAMVSVGGAPVLTMNVMIQTGTGRKVMIINYPWAKLRRYHP
jgi:hypothetical protein